MLEGLYFQLKNPPANKMMGLRLVGLRLMGLTNWWKYAAIWVSELGNLSTNFLVLVQTVYLVKIALAGRTMAMKKRMVPIMVIKLPIRVPAIPMVIK